MLADVTAGSGAISSAAAPFSIEHGLRSVSLSRAAVSPNGDGRGDVELLRIARSEATTVVVSLLAGGRSVRRLSGSRSGPGVTAVRLRLGSFRDGAYRVGVVSTGAGGAITATLPLVIDRTRPILTLVRIGQTRGVFSVRFRVSARATVALRSGHRVVVAEAVGPGRVVFHARARSLGRTLRLTAQDAAGNRARGLTIHR